MTTHARLLDRRRFDLVTGRGSADGALWALAGYRNADGGFGWALEPDLRSPESQPGGALHAFEVLEEAGPRTSELAGPLCDWLASVTLPDGGLPFALPVTEPAGSAPWWVGADPGESSLHITAAVAAVAHQVARHDPVVAGHPWLATATEFCLRRIGERQRPESTLELRYALSFLDAVHDTHPEAKAELHRMAAFVPADGTLAVEGGVEGEALHALDFSPLPDRPLRELITPEAVRADLERVLGQRRPDGGWVVDFATQTDAGALEWRGYATVAAVKLLLDHED
ncbi:hypothetical protein [Pseudonocardia acaciae]|uniref:hypothetical protein n=1 Tax=Pseudonocardia acaciae TaxID=551276 RepID=UPI001FE23435|nr:hypothetical protein [Pseudonocardia acaciae]